MSIITISRGAFSKGKEVAEKVAATLGYECISREVLIDASEQFNIPEIKLERALHDAPSILQRFTFGKERYLAHISEALLEKVQHDNVVYHGLAGQFLLPGISHALKVRILADMEDRAALEMAREHVDRETALARLRKDDQARRKWSRHLFGVDTWDPALYDMVLHVHKLTVANAVDFICSAARLEQFQATEASRRAMLGLLLAARVRARLVNDFPTVQVQASDGIVTLEVRFNMREEPELADSVKEMAGRVPGVREVHVHALQTSAYAHEKCDAL